MKKAKLNPLKLKWQFIMDPHEDDMDPIGCVFAGEKGSKIVAYHVTPEVGQHIAALHNKDLETLGTIDKLLKDSQGQK
jgi:hypothetical protein